MRSFRFFPLAPFATLVSSAVLLAACSGDDTAGPVPDSGTTPDATVDGSTDAGSIDGSIGRDSAADTSVPGDTSTPTDAPSDANKGDAADAGPTPLKHIFYIMMENHGYAELIGNTADAPYVNQLAGQYGVASSYYGVTHPSLPNYLAAVSGDYQGIFDDCAAGAGVTCAPEEFVPGSGDSTSTDLLTDAEATTAAATPHWFSGPTLVDQLDAKSISWKAYMQSIPAAGATDVTAPNVTVDAGDGGTTSVAVPLYAQKHDPFMYFSGIRGDGGTLAKIVPFDQLTTDLASAASTPAFVWISPDQCHDMHGMSSTNAALVNLPNCAYPASGLDHSIITMGDTFLQSTVTAIMASPAWSADPSAIVIVWDEDDYSGTSGCCGTPTGLDGGALGGAQVPAIVITSKNPTHQTVADPFNHYSLLATIESLWGLPCLANACHVPGLMTKLFRP